jgi:glutathione S-transferase
MKLYFAPGTCALGIHILLEEIGKPYELAPVDFRNRAQYEAEFMAVNPKSKVPVLMRDDGSVLTEYPAIATYLALTNPQAKLLPVDVEKHVRVLEMVDYCVASLHMQAFVRFWRPETMAPSESDHPALKARGKQMFDKGLSIVDKVLDGKDYVVGDFSIADPTLFFIEWWGVERMKTELPPNVAAHYKRMLARPSVQSALKQQGF